ncbi:MAG: SH3 domain-containing protein [Anaerolineae bacterium]|nr:SH3 domain-containing protein [Anaerolineae bacterium]
MKRHWLKKTFILTIILTILIGIPTAGVLAAPDNQGTVTVTATDYVKMRSGPGVEYEQIGQLPIGETVPLIGKSIDGTWYFFEYNGTSGWGSYVYLQVNGDINSVPIISAANTSAVVQATATPITGLRARSGPGTEYTQVASADALIPVPVLGRNADGSWILIDVNGVTGWVAARFCEVDRNVMSLSISNAEGGATPPAPAPQAQPDQPTAEPTTETPAPAQPAASPPATSSSVTAVPQARLRIRSGPNDQEPQIGTAEPLVPLPVLGRNAVGNWIFVDASSTRGWIAAWLCNIEGDYLSLPVTDAAGSSVETPAQPPEAPSPEPTQEPTPTPAPAPALPPAPAPSAGGTFELGGQSHSFANAGLMHGAGMTWIKVQQKWAPGENPANVAGKINEAHAAGLKILLSIPGHAFPSSIDYTAYVAYLAGVAALGPDGIEVWNEMNLDREWPNGQIDPGAYVNYMLAPAYTAIKATNPNVLVISGALAPTGANIPGAVVSDDRYLAGMSAAGAANYMDCLGVHYNAGATPPDQGFGHPADGGAAHYSWYFGGTYNLYANSFPRTKLCYTEIGYVSPEGYGPLASNFSWGAGTSVAEQAQWLGRSIQLLRGSGRVRLVIVFNVDISEYSSTDPQAGYAILRPDGSCPACGYLAGAMQ